MMLGVPWCGRRGMSLGHEGVVVAHEDRAAVPVLGGVGRAAVEATGVEHHEATDPDLRGVHP